MLVALDVHYAAHAATTAAVGFAAWSDEASILEYVTRSDAEPAPYEPGAFYRRELPFLLEAVTKVEERHRVEAAIVDGHVWLRAGEPGLGARLHEAIGARWAVVGVAKSAFAGGSAVPVLRGGSRRPLFVGAVGMDVHRAAALVRGMHGAHRMPTLLERADQLARGHAAPDRSKALYSSPG
jgi:deoxyribonuclease V